MMEHFLAACRFLNLYETLHGVRGNMNLLSKEKLYADLNLMVGFLLCSGILIKTLADASNEKHSLSAQQIVMNVVGFAATVATTIICTILAKKRLKTMPIEDEPLLQ